MAASKGIAASDATRRQIKEETELDIWIANDDGNCQGKDKVGENIVSICRSNENDDLRGLEKIQKADNTLIMYAGEFLNAICHFLLHIYWENKSKKETIKSKWRHNIRKKGRQNVQRLLYFSLWSYLAHISENWFYKIENHLTNQKKKKKSCVCFTSLYPFLKKEQDSKYTTQGSRLKCYSISLGYKIYQS